LPVLLTHKPKGGKQARQFFFEKKNQKTFVPLRARQTQRACKRVKVFCFFFSKKKSYSAASA
jgi:hypothetical protein